MKAIHRPTLRIWEEPGDEVGWKWIFLVTDGLPLKQQTINLLKFKRLMRLLGETERGLVGLLELLRREVGMNCPRGDVGRFSNEEIAVMCRWEGDPDRLVKAMLETSWLDPCNTHRLLVHGWAEHCPNWVKQKAEVKEGGFARLDWCPSPVATPNQTIPNQTKPDQESAHERDEFDSLDRLIDAWNALPACMVSHVRARRAEAIVKGWKRVRTSDVRDSFDDAGAIAAAIRTAKFCHGQGWFRFAWLFSRGGSGEWNVTKLLEGAYVTKRAGPASQQRLAGIDDAFAQAREDRERFKRRECG